MWERLVYFIRLCSLLVPLSRNSKNCTNYMLVMTDMKNKNTENLQHLGVKNAE